MTTLQIKAAQAVKRTKTGVRLNFEESVTAAELERLPSVEKLLNWRDEVYAKRFVNKGPITIKCLIGQVRSPASPLPAPPFLPSAKAYPASRGKHMHRQQGSPAQRCLAVSAHAGRGTRAPPLPPGAPDPCPPVCLQVKFPFVASKCANPECNAFIKKLLCQKCGSGPDGTYSYAGDVDVVDWNDAANVVTVGNITKGGESLFGVSAQALVGQNDMAALEKVGESKELLAYKVTIGVRYEPMKQAVSCTAFSWTRLQGEVVKQSPALQTLLGDLFE